MLRCQNLSRKGKSERTKEVNSYRNVLIVCVVIHHLFGEVVLPYSVK